MADTLTIEWVDPNTVLLGENIRRNPELDQEFVESIGRGVLTPCPAVRTADGGIMIEFGSRRRAAAIQAGVMLPVFVTGPEDTTRDGKVNRLFDQWDENDKRADLTAQDQAGFVQALLDFHVPQAEMRRRAGLDKATVTAAVLVARSERVMAGPPVPDLDMAAALAGFDAAGDSEAVTALEAEVASGRGAFRHAAQVLTDTQASRFQKRDLLAQLAEAGVTVLELDKNQDPVLPGGGRVDWGQHLTQLTDKPQLTGWGEPLTAEGHAQCPGHAAYLRRTGRWDETLHQHMAVHEAVFLCTDPDLYSHHARSVRTGPGKDKSDAAAAAATAKRRIVIDNNRLWKSARTVRRRWLTEFLTRKTLPDGGLLVIFEALTGQYGGDSDYAITEGIGHHKLACYLLGLTQSETAGHGGMVRDALLAASADRQKVITLGMVLGAWEASLGDDTWRPHVTETKGDSRYVQWKLARPFLLLLQSWGYVLSDLEKTVAGVTQEPAGDAKPAGPKTARPKTARPKAAAAAESELS
jgi:ParB family transcriptional regulator, chromosome partitioning protein